MGHDWHLWVWALLQLTCPGKPASAEHMPARQPIPVLRAAAFPGYDLKRGLQNIAKTIQRFPSQPTEKSWTNRS